MSAAVALCWRNRAGACDDGGSLRRRWRRWRMQWCMFVAGARSNARDCRSRAVAVPTCYDGGMQQFPKSAAQR
jgi:hypothetical protein